VVVYSSLDEPFFIHIGSEKISQLIETLGMKENEILQHAMISTSIERMQKKLEEKITIEQAARSQRQWMNANIATDQ
jgi:preprotein translocase subunit SecA